MSHYAYLITKSSFTCKEFKSEEEAVRLTTIFLDATEIDRNSTLVVFSESKLDEETITEAQKQIQSMSEAFSSIDDFNLNI